MSNSRAAPKKLNPKNQPRSAEFFVWDYIAQSHKCSLTHGTKSGKKTTPPRMDWNEKTLGLKRASVDKPFELLYLEPKRLSTLI